MCACGSRNIVPAGNASAVRPASRARAWRCRVGTQREAGPARAGQPAVGRPRGARAASGWFLAMGVSFPNFSFIRVRSRPSPSESGPASCAWRKAAWRRSAAEDHLEQADIIGDPFIHVLLADQARAHAAGPVGQMADLAVGRIELLAFFERIVFAIVRVLTRLAKLRTAAVSVSPGLGATSSGELSIA